MMGGAPQILRVAAYTLSVIDAVPVQAPSPLSAPWQRKQSRYSTGRVVTTPEQLKRYTVRACT